MDNLHGKVLSALKNCVDNPKCRDCPWEECEGPHAHVQLPKGLVEAVIGLLKAQEPVKPIENSGFYYCGTCRYAFATHRPKYCSECGKAVKWE